MIIKDSSFCNFIAPTFSPDRHRVIVESGRFCIIQSANKARQLRWSIELQNAKECDATVADSSNAVKYTMEKPPII